MEHASDEACRFQLPDLFCDELLALHCLFPNSLFDGPRMRTDGKVVLNHFPGNTGDVRWLPGKDIDIRPQKSDERAFLFGVESDTDGVRTPILSHTDLACNTSYHFAASRTVFPRVPPYLARDRLRLLAHVYDSVASIHMTENPGRHG